MAAIDTPAVRELLRAAALKRLLIEELGWDRYQSRVPITAGGKTFDLVGIAEKSGLCFFECTCSDGLMPDYQTRIAVEVELRKLVHEHIIVFLDGARKHQVWQWIRREAGRPRATREHHFHASQSGEALIAKLASLSFELSEQAGLTIGAVAERARTAFDVETVTRRFYERFQLEHKKFLAFIKGFTAQADAEWYASLMLNRLMFVYFIQKRGFIDADRNYLQNRLTAVKNDRAISSFHSFYRHFLLRLFHDGLSRPSNERSPELDSLLGDVPYLNGGLFDVHELEQAAPDLDIADEAFEELFGFFDSYSWNLDERPLAVDNEINPDVLGYIFEKYINQKEMGAYYTKEDITGYITGNTIGLVLLGKLGNAGAVERVRAMVRNDPSRYRNAPPPGPDTPPAEVEIADWADAVTANLDLTVVLDDVIQESDPTELWAVWNALQELSVLDPTCGSGAFLFAAVRILQPLLEACVSRMAALLGSSSLDDARAAAFAAVIGEMGKHPNQAYYILKCLILNNIYGVDIMDEAVEICKLRLFLKLAATLESAHSLEPLPDVDFNIRCGNSLLGFATSDDLERSISATLDFNGELEAITAHCEAVDHAYQQFRHLQEGDGATSVAAAKNALKEALTRLRTNVNRHLGVNIGIRSDELDTWGAEGKPFHWFGEYHAIMAKGGFDAIIGNPPYADVPRALPRPYLTQNYTTALPAWSRDEDAYALIVERSFSLLHRSGAFGMVLPLSVSFSTKQTFIRLRKVLSQQSGDWWFSHFDRIPSALFGNDVRTRCTIALLASTDLTGRLPTVSVTRLMRWTNDERDQLFDRLAYSPIAAIEDVGIPKIGSQLQAEAYKAMTAASQPLSEVLNRSLSFTSLANAAPEFPDNSVYVGGTAYNWFPVWRSIPPTTTAQGKPTLPARTAGFSFNTDAEANVVFALLASSLGYWWWAVAGDGFNLKKWLIQRFPLSPNAFSAQQRSELAVLGDDLRVELEMHYVYKDNRGRIGNWHLPSCAGHVRAIDDALTRMLPSLTGGMMADIRSFNASFSTSEAAGDGLDDGDDEG